MKLGQATSTRQKTRVPPGVLPLGQRLVDTPPHDEIVALVGDPVVQTFPLTRQRLVGDFDSASASGWVEIEGQQPMRTVELERLG